MSTPEKENTTMNPQIVRNFKVGTRDLRSLTIYPLSMGDQMELEQIITKLLTGWFKDNPDGGSNLEFVTFLLDFIKDNLVRVLELITDEEKEELARIGRSFSNFQATALANIIVTTNYLDPYEKNLKSLPLMDKLFQLGRQLPSFSEDSLNTESKISTESIIKTEESQKTNLNSSLKKPMKKRKV